MSAWAYLSLGALIAMMGDVFGKLSLGHSLLHYAIPAYICYILAIFCWIVAIKTLPIFSAYIIWTGICTVGLFIASVILFGEHFNPLKTISTIAVLIGCIGLVYVEKQS